MSQRLSRRPLASAALLAPFLALAAPAAAQAPAIDPYVDLRWRLELVDQQGLPEEATAATLRTKVGVKLGSWHGFHGLVEGEAIVRTGPSHFNDGTNGRTRYPLVPDASDHLLNQAVIGWADKSIGSVNAGRQAVNLENQRWVGSVGWRQNDQTLDIAQAEVTALKGFTFGYGYAWRVNRVFGPRNPQGIWRDNDIHLIRAAVEKTPIGRISAYAHLLDIPDAPQYSSRTIGARLTGRQAIGGAHLLYAAEFARQSDLGANPNRYAVSYLLVEPGIAAGPITARVGLERLEGNGTAALQTPLATLHAFNGWADKFLTTPADGLQDVYLDVTVAPKAPGVPKGLTLRTALHDFRSTNNSRPYGREFDVSLGAPVHKNITLLAKAALYESRGFATDTAKFWLQAEAKF